MIEETLSANAQFSTPHLVQSVNAGGLLFSLSIRGTFSGTLTLRQSFDKFTTFYETGDTYTAPISQMSVPIAENGVQFSIGFKDGDFVSGAAIVRLGSGVAQVP